MFVVSFYSPPPPLPRSHSGNAKIVRNSNVSSLLNKATEFDMPSDVSGTGTAAILIKNAAPSLFQDSSYVCGRSAALRKMRTLSLRDVIVVSPAKRDQARFEFHMRFGEGKSQQRDVGE